MRKLAQLPEPPPESEPPQREGDNQLPKNPIAHGLKTVGGGLLGFGVGTATGYGAEQLFEHLTNRSVPSGPIRALIPLVGGAGGLAYSVYKQKELEQLQNALASYKQQSLDRASGG